MRTPASAPPRSRSSRRAAKSWKTNSASNPTRRRSRFTSRFRPARSPQRPSKRRPTTCQRWRHLFVNRPVSLAQIAQRLDQPECRLLTLVGPGGIGKTRLALEAARQHLPEFRQGVYYVPLTAVSAPDFIVPAIANALDFTFRDDMTPEEELIRHLDGKAMLLVLDNFEHLMSGAALVSRILVGTREVKILATARERLNLREEWLFTVEALRVPAEDDFENAAQYAAVQLFVQSARRIQPDFDLEPNWAAVVRICQLTAGMPLAIELAASWVRLMTCDQIVAEIERSLDFLTTSLRNMPDRHQSIRAVFESSWDLLSEVEQEALRRISVFQGGFAREAAEAVAGVSLPTLTALADKSLLYFVNGRFAFHGMLRKYACEKLDAHPETRAAMYPAHSQFYAEFLSTRAEKLAQDQPKNVYTEVVREIDNIRAAWQHALDQGDEAAIGPFLWPLYRLYDIQSNYIEGEEAFGKAAKRLNAALEGERRLAAARAMMLHGACLHNLARYDEAWSLLRASLPALWTQADVREVRLALSCLGNIVYSRGDYRQARAYFKEVVELSRAADEPITLAKALLRLSDVATVQGDHGEARHVIEESLAILEEVGGDQARMRALLTLGDINLKLGQLEDAERNFTEALKLSEALGARTSEAVALVSLGRVAHALGDYARASALCRRSVAVCDEIRHRWNKAFALMHLGRACHAVGEYAKARHHYQSSLTESQEIGSRWITASVLRQMGDVHLKTGDSESADHALRRALKIAAAIQASPLALDVIAGVAAVEAARGEQARALQHARFVVQQPIAEYEARETASALLAELEPEAGAEIDAHSEDLTLAAVIDDILGA
ncbi:MAG: tetratricopeptide repeat protein [Anaerolineae bacterium]|nr:tetratricopeptide repeat protein [Anaerolineae bacterium]